eukprot:m.13367 g.13367  ORF g.13367 m.13367 type:complete len:217 (+) comp4540_c0_seq1:63-713(+)
MAPKRKRGEEEAGQAGDKTKRVAGEWLSHQVVPLVYSAAPPELLTVAHPCGFSPGMAATVTPTQVLERPTALSWPGLDPKSFYTVMLVDPDAPSKADPKFKCWLHFLYVNAFGAQLEAGIETAAFVPSAPGSGSGLHRYTWLVFEQSEAFCITNPPRIHGKAHVPVNSTFVPRRLFCPEQFVKSHPEQALRLVAGTFYFAEYDASCPDTHKRINAT